MAPPSSAPAWRIPGTEEPGGLQSTGSQRVGRALATERAHTRTFPKLIDEWSKVFSGYAHVKVKSVPQPFLFILQILLQF